MIIEDANAKLLRSESKMGREKQTLIDQYIHEKPNLQNMTEAMGYCDKLREVLKMQNTETKRINSQNTLMKVDMKRIEKEKEVLTIENEAKQDYMNMMHELVLKGS